MRVLARRQLFPSLLSLAILFLVCSLCYLFLSAPFSPTIVVFGDSWSDDARRPTPSSVLSASDSRPVIPDDESIFYTSASSESSSSESSSSSSSSNSEFGRGNHGRWCDGPVWPEYLCQMYGCRELLDLAYGGAKITNQYVSSPVPDLISQYSNFVDIRNATILAEEREDLDTIDDLVDSRKLSRAQAEEAVNRMRLQQNRETLYAFYFGINDIIQYISILPNTQDRTNAIASSVSLMFDIAANIAEGFPQSNFLFLNAIDVTLLPIWQQRFTENDRYMHRFREAVHLSQVWQQEVLIHLGRWNSTIGSAQIFETNSWLARSISGVAASGFTDISHACFDHASGTLCSKPETHFFWDAVHLSTAAHKALAKRLSYLNLWPSTSSFGDESDQ
ncbi:hypothetical protein BZA70DRAFT_271283 [Myxozyma melibiosi]|uniref:Uncharacterized protein n=1 Tax=Myxozyma melibiosi TaxID=54550 RepID=A0ABR1FC67_9ASCO